MASEAESKMEPDDGDSYEVAVERDVMVEMRDGVRLATDVYRPLRDSAPVSEALPVVLLRTPYDKGDRERSRWAILFARAGCVAVVQDCRGCFGSEGAVAFLVPEADDGYDAVAWIRDQAWCDGRVGTWGTSWSGWVQTALAAAGTEGIAAMVPTHSGANAYTSSVRHGGAMELRFLAWAFWHSAANSQATLKQDAWVDRALNVDAPSFSDWLRRWPVRRGATQLAQVPAYERWAFELLTHADHSDDWDHPSLNPSAHWQRFTDAPTLIVGGWYDSYARATFELYEGLAATKRGPIRALIGPWQHGRPEQPFAGDVWFGRDAAIDFFALHRDWFDRHLRHRDDGLADAAPIRLFVMGGGTGRRGPGGRLDHGGAWRDEHEWPLARTEFTPFYLHHDGRLDREPPAAAAPATTFRFDPADPVPTIGGSISSLADLGPLPPGVADSRLSSLDERLVDIVAAGGFDQRESAEVFGCRPPYLPLASRGDVLVYETAPLDHDTEVTGPIDVHLWVTSSAVDTDFTAKLIDVYPPSESYPRGYALNLTDSIIRLRYRDGSGTATLINPGEIVAATITLYPTSNRFAAGHRIRLDLSSSNFPRFDVNPNTGEPLGTSRRHTTADNTVFLDADHPSHVTLPIVPAPR